jgi:enoyl-CoA hydratase/carnithine racemase
MTGQRSTRWRQVGVGVGLPCCGPVEADLVDLFDPRILNVTYNSIAFDVDGPVAVLTLNRPQRLNAFTVEMCDEIISAFDVCDADDEVRVVIVTGEGRAFCAGADLGGGDGSAFATSKHGDGPYRLAKRDSGGLVNLRIFASTKPVIAAINGPAVGIGATMTLPMDIRLMSETARVGFVFASRGIVPDGASSWFLPRIVGIDKALEWCLTARVFGAPEALAAGLVRSVHPPGELLDAARSLAEEIASNSAPVSASITRTMLWRMLGAAHPMDAHRVDSLALAQTGDMADAAEGILAFMDKRAAQWRLRAPRDTPEWHPWWREPTYEEGR